MFELESAWARFGAVRVRSRELCAIASDRREAVGVQVARLLALRAAQLAMGAELEALDRRLRASLHVVAR